MNVWRTSPQKLVLSRLRGCLRAIIDPLGFYVPLAIFNATFELKRLLCEARHAPTGRIYDVMTACRLTHGLRPSLEQAARLYFDMDLPKTLGASDWGVATVSREQLDYAALVPLPRDYDSLNVFGYARTILIRAR
jgi:hypothetical protein